MQVNPFRFPVPIQQILHAHHHTNGFERSVWVKQVGSLFGSVAKILASGGDIFAKLNGIRKLVGHLGQSTQLWRLAGRSKTPQGICIFPNGLQGRHVG